MSIRANSKCATAPPFAPLSSRVRTVIAAPHRWPGLGRTLRKPVTQSSDIRHMAPPRHVLHPCPGTFYSASPSRATVAPCCGRGRAVSTATSDPSLSWSSCVEGSVPFSVCLIPALFQPTNRNGQGICTSPAPAMANQGRFLNPYCAFSLSLSVCVCARACACLSVSVAVAVAVAVSLSLSLSLCLSVSLSLPLPPSLPNPLPLLTLSSLALSHPRACLVFALRRCISSSLAES